MEGERLRSQGVPVSRQLQARARSLAVHQASACCSHAWLGPGIRGPGPGYIILDFCAGGDLFARMRSDAGFTWRHRLQVLSHCVDGLSHVHRLQLLHCDFKSQNLLISGDGSGVLADFGQACVLPHRQGYAKRANGGTIGESTAQRTL